MKVLAYTFRTFPAQAQLRIIFPDLFVLGSLKNDILVLQEQVAEQKPDLVVGVAKSDGRSRFEMTAVNRFNQTKKVLAEGKESFPLFVPSNVPFWASDQVTDSFCNWTAYRLADFFQSEGITARLSFCHISSKDISLLSKISQL